MRAGITILIPLWNEEAVVPFLLDDLNAGDLPAGAGILLLNDGSSDRTADAIAQWRRLHPAANVQSMDLPHGGKDSALWQGFEQVQTEWVGMMDGDGQYCPGDFRRLLKTAQEHPADAVWGIRGKRCDYGWRLFISRIGRKVKRLALGHCCVSDTGCGIWIAKASHLRSLRQQCPAPAGQVHCHLPEYIQSRGGTVVELDIQHRARQAGQAKFGALNRVLPGLRSIFQARRLVARSAGGSKNLPGDKIQ